MTSQREHKPNIVGWEITSQCNLTCPHCYSAAMRRPHNEMDTAECKSVIDALARIGVGTIGWTGGEPLMRKDLEELIAYAGENGLRCNITTNGVLLDRQRAESLLAAGNRTIQISLDGSTPELNRLMRRATDEEYYKIIDAIRICRNLNMRVYLATVVGQENLDDAWEMMNLAQREDVHSIRFCGFTPAGRGKRNDVKERLEFNRRMEELLEFVEKAQTEGPVIPSFDTAFGPIPFEYTFHKCVAGVETFYLKANGDIYPCTALAHRRFKVGNLRERPLEEIWHSDEMRAMSTYPREEVEGECRECDNFENCHGGCRGTTFAHTGDVNASFPVCLYRVAQRACVEDR
ncbi:MAG: radical SAM protein [Candidatus Zixiibacteriota bacterium]|jgi:radical SAM protein with 4Fe4S-binding SPASM domain